MPLNGFYGIAQHLRYVVNPRAGIASQRRGYRGIYAGFACDTPARAPSASIRLNAISNS
jgi:hypothetical protein